MYIVQYKPVQCDHRENICFCEQLGKLLPIMGTAGKSSWGERLSMRRDGKLFKMLM